MLKSNKKYSAWLIGLVQTGLSVTDSKLLTSTGLAWQALRSAALYGRAQNKSVEEGLSELN